MTENPAVPPRFLGLSAPAAAILVIAVATLFRFFYCAWLPLLPDEAYYFQWSRHLDASYISKGPAVAYTIWAATHLFGANRFGVRFFAVLLSAGTAWQIFLLARRWYDETAALIAVLLAGVVPLYAVGAVLMTIDPLSAFFWIWAANLFSSALESDGLAPWLLTGFAVGGGFLAKYINALELLAFIVFLLLVPERRRLLAGPGFWLLMGTALFCALPVGWWNGQHHWATAGQLSGRGHLGEPFHFQPGAFLAFFVDQAAVISPLLFLALLGAALAASGALLRGRISPAKEGPLLLLLLFLSVFLFYAVLASHLRCEPNWPAVSYLSLVVLLAGSWRQIAAARPRRIFLATAFVLAWVEMVLLHDTLALPLSRHTDPMSRALGWPELAARVDQVRRETQADEILTDGYREASMLAFDLPGQPFVFAEHHAPPASQYDFWPAVAVDAPHRVLWVTSGNPSPAVLDRFDSVEPAGGIEIFFRHGSQPLRAYHFYLCRNRAR